MAIGLAVRAIPFIRGLLQGKKGVDAVLAAKKAADVAKVAKGAAQAGVKARGLGRKAADVLIGPDLLSRKGELAGRLVPDVLMTGVNQMYMPETADLGDRLLAAGTDFGMSALPGIGASRFAKKLGASEGLQGGVDMAASMVGGMGAYPASEALLRTKDSILGGAGLSPYEKQALLQEQMMREQMRAQILKEMGVHRGSGTDTFMFENGLSA